MSTARSRRAVYFALNWSGHSAAEVNESAEDGSQRNLTEACPLGPHVVRRYVCSTSVGARKVHAFSSDPSIVAVKLQSVSVQSQTFACFWSSNERLLRCVELAVVSNEVFVAALRRNAPYQPGFHTFYGNDV
jgi:hypothetical protein